MINGYLLQKSSRSKILDCIIRYDPSVFRRLCIVCTYIKNFSSVLPSEGERKFLFGRCFVPCRLSLELSVEWSSIRDMSIRFLM